MLTIIGCGNSNREDDGVGVVVAERIRRRLERHPIPGVQCFDCGTAGMEVMFAARGSTALILVDACKPQASASPGAIYEVPGEELETVPDPGYSLHDFRWDHALHAARRMWGSEVPSDVTVYLVEAQSTDLGLELSPPVADAADAVYQRIMDRLAVVHAGRHENAQVELELKRGMLRIGADIYERYFDGRPAVIALPGEEGPALVPVDAVQGGLLLKQRNLAGDRALDLSEVLQHHGWDIHGHYPCQARWDAELGGLRLLRPESA